MDVRDREEGQVRRRGKSDRSAAIVLGFVLSAVLGGCASTSSLPPEASARRTSDRQRVTTDSAAAADYEVKSAQDARGRADKALTEGDVDLALYFYLEAVKLDSQDSDSYYKIAVINERKGNSNLAARAYAEVVQLDPDNALALQGLGVAYFEAHEIDSAQALLERAVAADDSLWRAHNVLGVIADTSGQYDVAAEHYSAALSAHPDTASILNNRGYSKYLAGNFDGAEEDFNAAIAADSGYDRAWHNLGLLYARQRKYGFALRALSKVTSDYVAANDVGYIAMLDGDYDAAETLFAEATRLSPRYYETAEENAEELRRRRSEAAVADSRP